MNLLCPNCQKMLQVPEQYAGQMMKCPLCSGSFTVPGLPAAPAAAPAMAAAVPASTARSREAAMLAQGADEDDIAPPTRPDSVPKPATSKAPPPAPPEGYTHTKSYTLNARVVPLVAPVALGLVFVLTFFPWVGLYPGGDKIDSQNAWGAAFGSFDPDTNWLLAYDQIRTGSAALPAFSASDPKPSISLLNIFFLFLFFPAMVALAVLSLLVRQGRLKLPPGVESVLPYRSAILAVVILAGLLLLLLQSWAGYGVENMVKDLADKSVAPIRATAKAEIVDYRYASVVAIFSPRTTFWFRVVLLLLLIGVVGAGLDFWLERRGNRPVPRADLMW